MTAVFYHPIVNDRWGSPHRKGTEAIDSAGTGPISGRWIYYVTATPPGQTCNNEEDRVNDSMECNVDVPLPEERLTLWARLQTLLADSPETARGLRELAGRVHRLNDLVDGFIEGQTSAVCPDCTRVCCVNRHGFHSRTDLVYLAALGRPLPAYDEDCVQTDPCQFLDTRGCSIPRALRPFRCNWYFCNPLLDHMDGLPSAATREFTRRFQELVDTRREMSDLVPPASDGPP